MKIKKPAYNAKELNSNIAYGMTSVDSVTQEELDSIQWLCEKSMNDDIQIERLQEQLYSQPKEIVEKIKKRLCDRLNIIAGYGQMTVDEFSFFVESEFTKDIEEILKEYGEEKK